MAAVAHPTRPQIRRNSPLSASNAPRGFTANAPVMQRIDVGDDSDSDDEPPPAIKFSKATQALLAGSAVPSSPPKRISPIDALHYGRSTSAGQAGLDTPSRGPYLKITRHSSPSASAEQGLKERGYTPPRIVYLNSKGPGSGQRSVSISGPYPQRFAVKRDPTPDAANKPELVTPAPAPRAIRITRLRSGSTASQGDHGNSGSASRPSSRSGDKGIGTDSELAVSHASSGTFHHQVPETISRHSNLTASRVRNAPQDVAPPSGTQRMKRVPVGTTGSFFKSRPVRGGFRRRESEENLSPVNDPQSGSASQPSGFNYTPQERSSVQADGLRSRSGSVNTRATSVEPVSVHDFAHHNKASHDARLSSRQGPSYFPRAPSSNEPRPGSRQASRELPRNRQPSNERSQHQAESNDQPPQTATSASFSQQPIVESGPPKMPAQKPPERIPSLGRATYRYAAPKLHTDASEDQENMPPPTFKRNIDQGFKYYGKPSLSLLSDDDKPSVRTVDETPVPVPHQEQRRALGAISGNTPHRAAPAPPPKMTVLDAATTTGGASTTKSRKKRQHMIVNGKIFTQMGRLGKGGSSDVYCVMAENYKTFALKRVKLTDCDESAVRGYKGEIDLLKKLTDVERVVRLFDWELNDEKRELVVLMEKGDTDLNRLLTLQLNGMDARFDSAFTRYHWKEMLECVQAVHEHDIVHQDLKPANFCLVQGRLKLIDFGIANAIDTDVTCNVHRDTNVGTPNYMSPESIMDTNDSSGSEKGVRSQKKDMRIGKSSDVWSLGCILYQMTYGKPPFAHISNQLSRIMAITNPKHVIEFPETGVGNATIPPALRGTLKRCLNRDPAKRPTCKQMLDRPDAFLSPEGDGISSVPMTEEVLGQIITKVIERCRDSKRGIPTAEEARLYPPSFMIKVREMLAEP